MTDNIDRKLKKQIAKHVRFIYLKLKVDSTEFRKNRTRATIAYAILPNKEKILYMALSLCNPNDNFSKKIGRNLALKRLFTKVHVNHPLDGDLLEIEEIQNLQEFILRKATSKLGKIYAYWSDLNYSSCKAKKTDLQYSNRKKVNWTRFLTVIESS